MQCTVLGLGYVVHNVWLEELNFLHTILLDLFGGSGTMILLWMLEYYLHKIIQAKKEDGVFGVPHSNFHWELAPNSPKLL